MDSYNILRKELVRFYPSFLMNNCADRPADKSGSLDQELDQLKAQCHFALPVEISLFLSVPIGLSDL